MTGHKFILDDLPGCRPVFAAYILGIRTTGLKYYNEALGTFLDTWREYDFAKARLKKLKTP